MLLVVFGAGASYDSLSSYLPPSLPDRRPPLANALFSVLYADTMRYFPVLQPLVPYLERSGVNVEQELQRIAAEGNENPRRASQLAAVRWYLQALIGQSTYLWDEQSNGVSNYKTLLDQIEQYRQGDSVLLVTFNYDTLLERALPSVGTRVSGLDDYISSPYKLVKLHGSINWAREVETDVSDLLALDDWSIVHGLIDRVASLRISDRFVYTTSNPIAREGAQAIFPAVAIPIEDKKHGFECPETHLNNLIELLPRVSRILTVGWRGAEVSFLELLRRHQGFSLRGIVVASERDTANETAGRLSEAGIKGSFAPFDGGFSRFVAERGIYSLFGG